MIEKPDMSNCTEKQFNAWYWGSFHEICNNCIHKCKQSHIVSLSCSKYIKEKKNEEVKEPSMA